MAIEFADVPIEVRRRAARALAALPDLASTPRDRRRAPRFGQATPVFRPDLPDAAYWEIEIAGVDTVLPMQGSEAARSDRGFILVSTGPHDVPVPHFSLDLAPPSQRLAQQGKVHRVVKLDALCYAAEDEKGGLVGHIGTIPPKLHGMPARRPGKLRAGWSTTMRKVDRPDAERAEEPDGEKGRPVRMRSSREPRPVTLTSWRSWHELTRGYAKTYGHHLAALADHAAGRWEIERRAEEFGEGIRSGTTHTVILLAEGDYALSGPGADLVTAELNPQPLPPRLLLTPHADVTARDTTFSVQLAYRSGETEELRYFVVPDDAPSTVPPADKCLGKE